MPWYFQKEIAFFYVKHKLWYIFHYVYTCNVIVKFMPVYVIPRYRLSNNVLLDKIYLKPKCIFSVFCLCLCVKTMAFCNFMCQYRNASSLQLDHQFTLQELWMKLM